VDEVSTQDVEVRGQLAAIRGTDAYFVSSEGQVFSFKKDRLRLLDSKPGNHGYRRFTVCAQGVETERLVHRVVAETFLGPAPVGKNTIRHLNGNPLDNRAENLCWGTMAENTADMLSHGRSVAGRKGTSHKLGRAGAESMRARFAEGASQASLAREFGVSLTTVSSVVQGRSWRDK
jgi:hypothetical protein